MVHVTSMPNPSSSARAKRLHTGPCCVAAGGRILPLEKTTVRADAIGGIARVVLEHRFKNIYGERLDVNYLVPLPADGAVSGYRFQIGGRVVVGEIDRRARARERFEEALASGKT